MTKRCYPSSRGSSSVRAAVRAPASTLAGLALTSLALGTLVYLSRPAGALFLSLELTVGLRHSLPAIFGPLNGSLPSLTHAFSFTLLSTLALGVSRRKAFLSAALWLSVETIFEVGQHASIGAQLETLGPRYSRYFQSGTFDPIDLAACAVGVGFALLVLHFVCLAALPKHTETNERRFHSFAVTELYLTACVLVAQFAACNAASYSESVASQNYVHSNQMRFR